MGAFQPKELSGRHKEVLRLSVIGMSSAEIQKHTGVSKWHQARIRNSQKGRGFMEELHRRLDMIAVQYIAASAFAGTTGGDLPGRL